MNSSKPIRILHVVGGMDRGGIETWLVHVLRHLERDRFQTDIVVHTPGPFAYDADLEALGVRTLCCPGSRRPWRYARAFRRLLREHGPYDVVHSHVHHYSGFVLRLARQMGVPVRIAHSHLDYSGAEETGLFRRLYFRLMNRWLNRHMTVGLGASRQAAAALFGPRWEQQEGRRLLYYGIDLAAFHAAVSPAAVRAALGIPADAFVIGHAGRMMDQKNHKFLIEIAAQVACREPRARLLLVGDGPLRGALEQQVRQAGLSDRVVFAGVRPDVAQLMVGAMDLFLFPSLYEGLGLVALEAQAAGMPLVLSDTIPPEVEVIPPLVSWCSLSQPASHWADRILAVRQSAPAVSREHALGLMENSPFTIQRSVKELERLYAGAVLPA